MFTITKQYKTIFLSFIKNDFTPDAPNYGNDLVENQFSGNSLSELKILQKSLTDGRIDTREAEEISKNLDKITNETKEGLREISKELLKNGFTISNEQEYNSFKSIIENSGEKLIEWSDIKIPNSIQEKFGSEIKSVLIKGNEIIVKTNKMPENISLRLINKDNELRFGGLGNWSRIKEEKISSNILDDNINSINLSLQKEKLIEKYGENSDSFGEGFLEQQEKTEEPIVMYGEDAKDSGEIVSGQQEEIITEEAQRINDIKEQTKSISIDGYNLQEKDGKIFLTSNDNKNKAYFTINNIENLHIKTSNDIKSWSEKFINKWEKPKVEEELKEKQEDKEIPKEETKEEISKEKEIKYELSSDDVIKNAIKNLEHNNINSVNQEQIIGTYIIDGKEQDIVLKGSKDNLKVELNGTGVVDDMDLKVETNEIKDIKEKVNKLVEIYEKEIKKEEEIVEKKEEEELEKNTFPKKLGIYTNINGEEKNIILKKSVNPGVEGVSKERISYMVELDESGKFIDPDISFDKHPSKEEIEKAINKLLEEYNKEVAEKQKETEIKKEKEKQKEAEEKEKSDKERKEELNELFLTREDLSEADIKELKEADGVNIDLSDIKLIKTISSFDEVSEKSTRTGAEYEIDIDGFNNLIIRKEQGKDYEITDTNGKFISRMSESNSLKDVIINGTNILNKNNDK